MKNPSMYGIIFGTLILSSYESFRRVFFMGEYNQIALMVFSIFSAISFFAIIISKDK